MDSGPQYERRSKQLTVGRPPRVQQCLRRATEGRDHPSLGRWSCRRLYV